jgi:hypothetical protein
MCTPNRGRSRRNWYPTAYSTWGKRPDTPTRRPRGFCNLQRVGIGRVHADSTSALNIFDEADLTPLGAGNRNQLGVQVRAAQKRCATSSRQKNETEIGVLSLPQFERERFAEQGLPIREWTERPNAWVGVDSHESERGSQSQARRGDEHELHHG